MVKHGAFVCSFMQTKTLRAHSFENLMIGDTCFKGQLGEDSLTVSIFLSLSCKRAKLALKRAKTGT